MKVVILYDYNLKIFSIKIIVIILSNKISVFDNILYWDPDLDDSQLILNTNFDIEIIYFLNQLLFLNLEN